MKKCLPLIFSVVFLIGCTTDDDAGNIAQNLAPTISVDLPDNFVFGQSYDIKVLYKRPSTCHSFSGLDVARNANVITIGVVTSFPTNNPNCVTTGNLEASAIINFVAERDDFYIFKFWQGRTSGIDKFLIIQVPVTPPAMN